MQGLVNYGSDSEDGGSDTEAPVVPPLPTKASSSSLSLPPPKTSSSLSLPPLSASSVPAKKPKGPVRIMLDLPAPSSSSSDEPPAKKLKFTPSSSSSAGLSGLAAMLPKPKNESVEIKLEKASGGGGGKPTVGVGAFMPHSVGKGKGKKTGTGPAVPSNVVANEVKEVEQEEAPAEDFFGLEKGSVTSSSSSSLLSRPLKSSAPSISSAPTLATPARQSTFGDPPTDSDPYPGFTQLPSGEWVARDAKTYELWMASMQQQSQEAPKGFEEKEMDRLGVEEFDAGKVREAWANRPNQVVKPGQEDKEGEKAKPVVKAAKLASGRARGKHQLSTLLNEAIENRQELEDRIAQGRANRKGAGNKYGF